jgi:hypothetical protein
MVKETTMLVKVIDTDVVVIGIEKIVYRQF